MSKKRIGVLTSGGDCPGLNAVLRAIYCAAEGLGWEAIGFRDGYEGMLPEGGDTMLLTRENTAGIMQVGGTILGTTNKGHFISKVAGGDKMEISEAVISRASKTCRDLDLSAIIAIGGDGSMNTALQLYRAGFPMIGVPKTIDNDLEATAMTFGFDSAVACVTDSLDRLHTTAASHKRLIVVQVMGRHAGWIALWGGLAGAADIILIPEIPFSLEKISEAVQRREEAGFKSTILVVAEGARAHHGQQFRKQSSSGEWRLGGVGEMLAHEIEARTGKETRACILGHLQRGGDPTSLDRILGTRFGVKAVQLAQEDKFGTMVSYQNYEVMDVPIADAIHRLKRVQPDCQLVETAALSALALEIRMQKIAAELKNAIRSIPDFPKQGILFRDVSPLLEDATLFALTIDLLAKQCESMNFTKIIGLDARGFIFGAALAYKLGVGFVPVRKKGKLPPETLSHAYELEYGSAEFEIHRNSIAPGEGVIVVDDLLATGGTAAAALHLLKQLGAEILSVLVVIELDFLQGRAVLAPTEVRSLVNYTD